MNLITQLLSELGADNMRAFTVCPGQLGYFRGVKAVAELTPQKIALICSKYTITAEGEGLFCAEYFGGDIVIRGNIKRVSVE